MAGYEPVRKNLRPRGGYTKCTTLSLHRYLYANTILVWRIIRFKVNNRAKEWATTRWLSLQWSVTVPEYGILHVLLLRLHQDNTRVLVLGMAARTVLGDPEKLSRDDVAESNRTSLKLGYWTSLKYLNHLNRSGWCQFLNGDHRATPRGDGILKNGGSQFFLRHCKRNTCNRKNLRYGLCELNVGMEIKFDRHTSTRCYILQ